MKLIKRQLVPGTEPAAYVGHRVYRDRRTGRDKYSARWTLEYCLDGCQRQVALGTTDRGEAYRKAHRIVYALRRGDEPKRPRRVSVEQVWDAWHDEKRDEGVKYRTLLKYDLVRRDVYEFLGSRRRDPMTLFDTGRFWKLAAWYRQTRGLHEKTIYDRLVIVKQVFKHATTKQLIAANPLTGAKLKKPDSAPQPCFTPDQIRRMLEVADPHLAPIVAVLAWTGMRLGEMIDLRWSDVLTDGAGSGFICIRFGGSSDSTKNRRLRRIPIHSRLRPYLDALPCDSEHVFVGWAADGRRNAGRPLNPRSVLEAVKDLCRRAGFANPDQYKVHTFRHAFASMCARNNVSYKYALEWLGHSSSDILNVYYTMYDDTAVAAMETIQYHRGEQERTA